MIILLTSNCICYAATYGLMGVKERFNNVFSRKEEHKQHKMDDMDDIKTTV